MNDFHRTDFGYFFLIEFSYFNLISKSTMNYSCDSFCVWLRYSIRTSAVSI